MKLMSNFLQRTITFWRTIKIDWILTLNLAHLNTLIPLKRWWLRINLLRSVWLRTYTLLPIFSKNKINSHINDPYPPKYSTLLFILGNRIGDKIKLRTIFHLQLKRKFVYLKGTIFRKSKNIVFELIGFFLKITKTILNVGFRSLLSIHEIFQFHICHIF